MWLMKSVLARDLSKTYWFYEKEAGIFGSIRSLFKGKKVSVEAVRGINLELEIGEVVGFIGPNGAGKTTTLKMLAGILYPTGGHVEVMGFLPFRREKEFLRKITFVTGQRNRLFWDLPAEDYFEFCRVIYEIPEGVFRKRLKELVELADIGDILRVPQRKLSAGQRKRCELVAALLHDPKVIFLDEPTNAMDMINARKVREFISEMGKSGEYTIILTSHNMSDIEQVCGRVIIINLGRIVFDGDIQTLSRMNGFRKRIKVSFHSPFDAGQLQRLGHLREVNGQEVLLEVEPDRATSVASYLFSNFPVRDLGIADPPLEEVIGAYFSKTLS